jgi:hypothetical protein
VHYYPRPHVHYVRPAYPVYSYPRYYGPQNYIGISGPRYSFQLGF